MNIKKIYQRIKNRWWNKKRKVFMYEDDEWMNIRAEACEWAKNKEETLLKKWLDDIGYKEPIGYYRDSLNLTMVIYATRVGALIGVEGVKVDKLRKILSEEFYGEWKVKFVEVRGGFVNM